MRTESLIRSLVRQILTESFEDVILISASVRIKTGRNVRDVLTSIRGLEKVVTVTQDVPASKAEDGKERLLLTIKFEDDGTVGIDTLEKSIKQVDGVDMVNMKHLEGVSGDFDKSSGEPKSPDTHENPANRPAPRSDDSLSGVLPELPSSRRASLTPEK